MNLERRFFTLNNIEVRATGDTQGRMIRGHAAVFNSLSQVMMGFREQVMPGAFTETLGDDIRALWNHNTDFPLGRTAAGTLRLAEDVTGLFCEIDPPDTQMGHDAVISIQRGDVSQMSFAFNVLDETWNEDQDGQIIRSLVKLKLYEVSPVVFPAYTATDVGIRGGLQVYGYIPEIPAKFVRAHDLASGKSEQSGRFENRKRRLDLMNRE